MKRLISMLAYIKLIDSQAGNGGHYNKIVKYCWFLSRLLKLEMFVPCDEEGNVLEKPNMINDVYEYHKKLEQYQKALSKVLFKGFECNGKWDIVTKGHSSKPNYIELDIDRFYNMTIEDLIKYNLERTDNKM